MGKTKDLVLQMSKQLNDVHVFMMGLETEFANMKMKIGEMECVTNRLSEENQVLHKKVSILEDVLNTCVKKDEFDTVITSLSDSVTELFNRVNNMEGQGVLNTSLKQLNRERSDKDVKPFVLPGTDVVVKKNSVPSSIILRNNEHGYAATFDTVRNVVTKVEKGHVSTAWAMAKDDYERQVTPEYFKNPLDEKVRVTEMNPQTNEGGNRNLPMREAMRFFNDRILEQGILIHNLQKELAEKAFVIDVEEQARLLKQLDGRINLIENDLKALSKVDAALADDVREQARLIKRLEASLKFSSDNATAIDEKYVQKFNELDTRIRTLNSSIHLLENRASVGDEVDKALSLSMDIVSAKIEKMEQKHGDVPIVSTPQLMNYETNGERAVITPVTSQGVSLSEAVSRLQVMERKLKDLGTTITEVANQQHQDKEGLWRTVNSQYTKVMAVESKLENLEITSDTIYTNAKESNEDIKRLNEGLRDLESEMNVRLTGIYKRMDGIDETVMNNSSTAYKDHKTVLQLVTENANKLSDLDTSVTKTAYALDDKIRNLHKETAKISENMLQSTVNLAEAMQKGFEVVGVKFVVPVSEEKKQEVEIWTKELDGVPFIVKKD